MVRHKITLASFWLALSLYLVACSPGVVVKPTPPGVNVESIAPSKGYQKWVRFLAASGASVEIAGEVSQPFFTVDGQVIKVNGSELQLFTYGDEAAARAEAALVSPDGTGVGSSIMMWMATPHFYHSGSDIALYLGDDHNVLELLDQVFGPQFAGGRAIAGIDEIGAAALADLALTGWDIGGFTAETTAVDGEFARAEIVSTNPPGGFTAFLQRQDGTWRLLTQGSAFNPAELKALGIPDAILGQWGSIAGSGDIEAAALAGLEKIGWHAAGFTAKATAIEGEYARVSITSGDGGFTLFMARHDGEWTVAVHGSAWDPDQIKALGFPDSLLP